MEDEPLHGDRSKGQSRRYPKQSYQPLSRAARVRRVLRGLTGIALDAASNVAVPLTGPAAAVGLASGTWAPLVVFASAVAGSVIAQPLAGGSAIDLAHDQFAGDMGRLTQSRKLRIDAAYEHDHEPQFLWTAVADKLRLFRINDLRILPKQGLCYLFALGLSLAAPGVLAPGASLAEIAALEGLVLAPHGLAIVSDVLTRAKPELALVNEREREQKRLFRFFTTLTKSLDFRHFEHDE
jgi:hypothetical protein